MPRSRRWCWTISQRDATDRAAAITAPSKALTLLDRARRNNDAHLSAAIAQRAVDAGWRDVIDSYVGGDPDNQAAYDTITDHRNRVGTPGDKINRSMFFKGGAPDELRGMSAQNVRALADQAPTTE